MTYKIPRQKKKKASPNYQLKEQQDINNILFGEKKLKDTEPKLLKIIIITQKEHYFNFFRNETEFEVAGKWHNKKQKLFEEENAEIEIVFYDDKDNTKSNQLMTKLKGYNKKYVKEQVLYTTISPIDKTSL